jgi:hypothetical protein
VTVLYIVASHAYQLIALTVLATVLARNGRVAIPENARAVVSHVWNRIMVRSRSQGERDGDDST